MADYSKQQDEQEASNYAACRAAFDMAHPNENPESSEECDAGSWSCPACPWKKTAAFHKENQTWTKK